MHSQRNKGFALLELLFVSLLLSCLMVFLLNFLRNQQLLLVDQVAGQQLGRLMNAIIVPIVKAGNQCPIHTLSFVSQCGVRLSDAEMKEFGRYGIDIYASVIESKSRNSLSLTLVKTSSLVDGHLVPFLSDFRLQRISHQSLANLSPDSLSCLDSQNGSPFSYTLSDATFNFTVRPGC